MNRIAGLRLSWRPPVLGGAVLLALAGAVLTAPSANAGDDSCPLTVSQKVASVKAFKGLAPIFKEPRCLNCHGAVNPFSRTGGHGGGYINIRQEAGDFLNAPGEKSLSVGSDPDGSHAAKAVADIKQIADSATEISDNDLIRQKAHDPMHQICKECHISSWIIPLRHNYFVDRDWKAMCVHVKTSPLTDSPGVFLEHIQKDGLVLAGFTGRRGLLEAVAPEPPAVSHATVTKYAKDWVAAMGGQFHRPPDCGCKADGIILEVQHRIHEDPTSPQSLVGGTQFDGTVKFDVLLSHDDRKPDGFFDGTISVKRSFVVRHVIPSAWICAGTGDQIEHWHFFAKVSPGGDTMHITFETLPVDEHASWTCTQAGMSFTDKLYVDTVGSLDSIDMPVSNGAKRDLFDRSGGTIEELSVTVIDNPADK